MIYDKNLVYHYHIIVKSNMFSKKLIKFFFYGQKRLDLVNDLFVAPVAQLDRATDF